jgi:deoxyadenosine/deoxycytidine kinase
MERVIERSYLSELAERYNHHFFHYEECPVLIINTDSVDFVANEKHRAQILEAIARCPSQTTYFVPEGN